MTALGDAATALSAGSWVELSTTGWTASFTETEGDPILVWGCTGCWDPTYRKVLFCGKGAHASDGKLAIYDEATNTWSEGPSASWMAPNAWHANDCNAIDQANHILYFQREAGGVFYRFDIAANAWTTSTDALSADPTISPADCFVARSGRIYAMHGYDIVYWNGSDWVTESTIDDYLGYSAIKAYSPVDETIIFACDNLMYALGPTGDPVKLATPEPGDLNYGAGAFHLVGDPVSGDILAWGSPGTYYQQLWKYDISAEDWTRLTDNSVLTASTSNDGIMAIPISTYGVIMFVEANHSNGANKVWLYKHQASSAPPTGKATLIAR